MKNQSGVKLLHGGDLYDSMMPTGVKLSGSTLQVFWQKLRQ